jgi:transcriptional regulator with XRE-family HTH domain
MKRLKQTREAFGYAVERLESELKLPAQTIMTWETGKRAPTLSELRDLAMVYGEGG